MTDTLQNIELKPRNVWVDVYAASGLAQGSKIQIENLSPFPIRMFEGETPPTNADEDSGEGYFRRITAYATKTSFDGNNGVWLLAETEGGIVNVSQDKPLSVVDSSVEKSAFGEALAIEPTPLAQIVGTAGLTDKVSSFVLNGGTTSATDGNFNSISGIDPAGTGSVVTVRQAKYRAGQGVLARLSAIFDTPQINSVQHAGLINISNRFVFGYEGDQFGISHVYGGDLEIQELTIATGATGSETATITVDGVGYSVNLTAGTAAHNAFEIAVDLNSSVAGYTFTANQNEVVAKSLLTSQGGGSFAFTSATAVASWEQITASQVPTTDFYPQAQWNKNRMPNLDPQKGNVYQVRMQYTGYGTIRFYVEDDQSGDMALVHVIRYQNKNIVPVVNEPIMRVGWFVENSGNTTSITLKGGSAGLFIEGEIVVDEPTRSDDNTNPNIVFGTFKNIITLRNRLIFNGKQNRFDVFGLLLDVANTVGKTIIVKAIINADISGEDIIYDYIDKEDSITEVYKGVDGVVDINSGRTVASKIIVPNTSASLELPAIKALLLAGFAVTICAALTTNGTASEVSASFVIQEDL